MSNPFEFYETPDAFSDYLFRTVDIRGRCFSPCVGSGAIVGRGSGELTGRHWRTNDIDPRWPADSHDDATDRACWLSAGTVDWTVDNPPFDKAIEIIKLALEFSRVGVVMHLRASIHEVLKDDPERRTFMSRHTPTGNLWLPRFGFQRSPTTGKWTTDSVCSCWLVWRKDPAAAQFIHYAPEWVIDQLDEETPAYRARMDALMATLDPTYTERVAQLELATSERGKAERRAKKAARLAAKAAEEGVAHE